MGGAKIIRLIICPKRKRYTNPTVYRLPLRDVVGLKSGEYRRLKKGTTQAFPSATTRHNENTPETKTKAIYPFNHGSSDRSRNNDQPKRVRRLLVYNSLCSTLLNRVSKQTRSSLVQSRRFLLPGAYCTCPTPPSGSFQLKTTGVAEYAYAPLLISPQNEFDHTRPSIHPKFAKRKRPIGKTQAGNTVPQNRRRILLPLPCSALLLKKTPNTYRS